MDGNLGSYQHFILTNVAVTNFVFISGCYISNTFSRTYVSKSAISTVTINVKKQRCDNHKVRILYPDKPFFKDTRKTFLIIKAYVHFKNNV